MATVNNQNSYVGTPDADSIGGTTGADSLAGAAGNHPCRRQISR